MKRLTIYFLIITMLSISVSAYESIYDNYVYTLDTFTVEDDLYYAVLANNNQVLQLHKNNELFFIHNGSCEETSYYKYCYNGTKLDYEKYGRPIPNSMSWEPSIHVIIFSKKPIVTIKRSMDSKINLESNLIITIEIENTGKLPIKNVIFEDLIPENVEFIPSEGLTKSGNKIIWSSPFLNKEKTASFSYRLKPKDYNAIVLEKGLLKYDYEELTFNKTIAKASASINNPFSWSLSTKKAVSLEEEFKYTLTYTNNDLNDDMKIDFTIELPEQIKIVKATGVSAYSNNIKHSLKLEPKEKKTFEITLRSKSTGNYNIKLDSESTIRSETLTVHNTSKVTVTILEIKPLLLVSKTEVFEGSPYTVVASINNPSNVIFYDVTGTIYSPLFETETFNLKGISGNSIITILDEVFYAPIVSEKTDYEIILKGNYRTSNNQNFNFETNKKIAVKPKTVGFTIEKKVSKNTLKEEEEATITLNVKNSGDKPGILVVEELIPEPLKVSAGLTRKALLINPGDKHQFYIYKVKAPYGTPAGKYELVSTITFNDEYIESKNTTITIVSETKQEPEEQETSKDIEPITKKESEKKPGFLKSVLNFFVALFS